MNHRKLPALFRAVRRPILAVALLAALMLTLPGAEPAQAQSYDSGQDFDTLVAAGNRGPLDIWSNGTTMWVWDTADDKLYAYKMSDESRDAAKDFDTLIAAGNGSRQVVWSNGTTMWVADSGDDTLYASTMNPGATDHGSRDDTKEFGLSGFDADPRGIWSHGGAIWVVDSADDKLYAYTMSDKSRRADQDFGALAAAGNGHLTAHWSDGTTMWVVDGLGEDLVTNPEAHSVPEELLLRPDGYSILALSNQAEPGQVLMSVEQIEQLRRHLRSIHDRFKGLYDPAAGERFAMEIEFKITSENVLASKQARPWVFPGETCA